MSISTFLIPFTNDPQSFELNISGIDYNFTNKWNDQPDGGWVIDISDSDNVPIICNIPLVTGADLLEGLAYLGIVGSLIVATKGAQADDVPTFENLGVESNVYLQVVDV